MRRPIVFLVLVAALVALAATAAPSAPAAASSRPKVLHVGSYGRRVKDLKWLLSGHRPSVYRRTVHPYRGRITRRFDKRTAFAVAAAKWRLGYPKRSVNGRAGPQLFRFLLGRKARPLGWIARASARARRSAHAVEVGKGRCARRIIRTAAHELGVREYPYGSNFGWRVARYEAVTRAWHAAWCVSFAQWVYLHAGVGTFANRTAGVSYALYWFRAHAWLRARPKAGAIVMYVYHASHMGIVTQVTRSGFYSIEGNHNNGVNTAWHPVGYRGSVFAYPACIR
jgi:CHAP domain